MPNTIHPPIFFVTVFEELPCGNPLVDMGTRCVGYFYEFSDAEERVIENAADINEGCYPYAVIEKVREGFYQFANPKRVADSGEEQERWFYRFNRETSKYEPMDEPECMQHLVGLGIG